MTAYRPDATAVSSCSTFGTPYTYSQFIALHFHLSISSSDAYEDAEFAYMPLLDDNRDRDLIDILPDYLTEEICFPRSHAAKFYAKVVDCMTKKIVVED